MVPFCNLYAFIYYSNIIAATLESEDRKLKFDWPHFINKEPKFWDRMVSRIILEYD